MKYAISIAIATEHRTANRSPIQAFWKSAEKQTPAKAAPKAETAAEKPAATAKPALPLVPADAQGVWERVMDTVKKKDPSLISFLKNARFIGEKSNVYRVMLPLDRKTHADFLNQGARKERICAILSEITQKPAMFEAVVAEDKGAMRMDSVRSEAQKSLEDTFGRENLIIDEGK